MDVNGSGQSRCAQLVLSLLTCTILLFSSASHARRISVDFTGGDPDVSPNGDDWVTSNDSTICATVNDDPIDDPLDNPTNGSIAPASCGVVFTDNSSQRIRLGFNVKIGDTLYDSIWVNRRGFVSFGTPRPLQSTFTPVTTLDALRADITQSGTVTRPFIAPFYSDFVFPLPGDETQFAPFGGGSAYFRAFADPVAPFSQAEVRPAIAVLWIQADDPSDTEDSSVYTQLVIYSTNSAGDWQLRLRYGNDESTAYNEPGDVVPGFAGVSLETGQNADSFAVPNPLSGAETTDYFYTFVNGHLSTGAPADGDSDGVPDSSDNCPNAANADQADADGDGLGNVCDDDRDGDGVGNASDNCPDTSNANQADLDHDGVGNACDADRDGDGVANATDNCPDAANASQVDTDHDGLGDACDATPAPRKCDVDADNDIDVRDLDAILRALGRAASGPSDPRDFDSNGKIQLIDLAKCSLRCTRRLCSVR